MVKDTYTVRFFSFNVKHKFVNKVEQLFVRTHFFCCPRLDLWLHTLLQAFAGSFTLPPSHGSHLWAFLEPLLVLTVSLEISGGRAFKVVMANLAQ